MNLNLVKLIEDRFLLLHAYLSIIHLTHLLMMTYSTAFAILVIVARIVFFVYLARLILMNA
jgi:hypothetical protein